VLLEEVVEVLVGILEVDMEMVELLEEVVVWVEVVVLLEEVVEVMVGILEVDMEMVMDVNINIQYCLVQMNIHYCLVQMNIHYCQVLMNIQYCLVQMNIHYCLVQMNIHYRLFDMYILDVLVHVNYLIYNKNPKIFLQLLFQLHQRHIQFVCLLNFHSY
jgi:hypothetical protein